MRRPQRRRLDLEAVEREPHDLLAQLVRHERLEIHRRDALLAVGELLEAREGGVERLSVEREAHLLESFVQRVAAGVLAEDDRVAVQPHRGGVHDLVRRALLQHAVLVDPRLVGEGVAPDDRLVRLHGVAREARHQAAGAGYLRRLDAGPEAEPRLARAQQHHYLLQRRVAGSLADSVHRALDLAAARFEAGQRVRNGQAQVVVAVHRDRHVPQPGDELVQLAEHAAYSPGSA